jgi:hypothetical protein
MVPAEGPFLIGFASLEAASVQRGIRGSWCFAHLGPTWCSVRRACSRKHHIVCWRAAGYVSQSVVS